MAEEQKRIEEENIMLEKNYTSQKEELKDKDNKLRVVYIYIYIYIYIRRCIQKIEKFRWN